MTNETIFEKAGRLFYSREQVKELEKRINAAGINMPADSFAGYVGINIFLVTVSLSAVILLSRQIMDQLSGAESIGIRLPFPIIILGVIIFSLAAAYLCVKGLTSTYLLMKTDDRRNKLEAVLPDFLLLVGSNIKAGMTLDQAMWYSAKPEFGLLSSEVKETVKGAFSGENFENALERLSIRFDSRIFRRTIMLLKQASTSGGELTSVLERTAEDVRNNALMKKEIAATLVLYEIFVLVASVIGTPFLFAVAGKIIQVFEKIVPQISSAGNIGAVGSGGVLGTLSGIKIGAPVITSNQFFWFSIPIIFGTVLISAFIVSIIRTGTKNQGMKYFPFMLLAAYAIYWIVSAGIQTFFSALS